MEHVVNLRMQEENKPWWSNRDEAELQLETQGIMYLEFLFLARKQENWQQHPELALNFLYTS